MYRRGNRRRARRRWRTVRRTFTIDLNAKSNRKEQFVSHFAFNSPPLFSFDVDAKVRFHPRLSELYPLPLSADVRISQNGGSSGIGSSGARGRGGSDGQEERHEPRNHGISVVSQKEVYRPEICVLSRVWRIVRGYRQGSDHAVSRARHLETPFSVTAHDT